MISVRIGLISDTHGLLRAEAIELMQGCDRIVHAGDIGDSSILSRLESIAPVTAVRGNNDKGPWAEALPLVARLSIGQNTVLVIHDLAEVPDAAATGVRVIVSGHSHRPVIQDRDGVLYVNPGSAGRRRFKLPITVAELQVAGDEFSARIHEISQ